jgi:YesN/AraC family two-component response regulator
VKNRCFIFIWFGFAVFFCAVLLQCSDYRGDKNASASLSNDSLKTLIYTWEQQTSELPENAIEYIETFRQISAEKENYQDLCIALKSRYNYYNSRSNLAETYQSALERVAAAQKSNDSLLIYDALFTTGKVLFTTGNHWEGLDYFLQLTDINTIAANQRATLFYELARFYANSNTGYNRNYAAKYYALADAETQKKDFTNTSLKGMILSGKGSIYIPLSEQHLFDFYNPEPSRIDSFTNGIKLLEESTKYIDNHVDYGVIALGYALLGKYEQVKIYEQKAAELAAVAETQNNDAASYITALIRYRQRRFYEVLILANENLETALANKNYAAAAKNADILYHTHINIGNYRKAIEYLENKTIFKDSIIAKERHEHAVMNKVKYDTQSKAEQLQHQKNNKREYHIRIKITSIISLIIIALLGLLFVLRKQKQKAYRELILKNKRWAGVQLTKEEKIRETDTKAHEQIDTTIPHSMDRLVMNEILTLIEDGIHKTPNLTIETIADKLHISETYVEIAINRCTEKNFKTFINEHRIKDAILTLSDIDSENLSHEKLASNLGFDDRKSFYQTFKKYTGLLPPDFKKNISF